MLFNSYSFPVFLVVFLFVYFPLPTLLRKWWLLFASCIFYMVLIPKYLLILLFLIAVDYISGLALVSAEGGRKRAVLWVSLAANLGTLFAFKYYGFFAHELQAALAYCGVHLSLSTWQMALPVGLSFHTFQSLSYVIEVYRGNTPPERNPLNYALYVMFWPQLVAGPIERPNHLLPQFHRARHFNVSLVREGLLWILIGYIKKMVIADRLALYVDEVYANPAANHGWPLWLATYFFAIQIYCDFSGYTDIARGCARVFGYDLSINFRAPYLASSVQDFWRRWHISLSSWFRDYVYIPLGGNRVPLWRQDVNLLAVFLLSGLWHGANWTFVVWGGLHGLYLVCERKLQSRKAGPMHGWKRAVGMIATFHLVSFAWIFFRAESLTSAVSILRNLFVFGGAEGSVAISGRQLAVRILIISTLLGMEWLWESGKFRSWWGHFRLWQRWLLYYLGVAAIFFMGIFTTAKFIYFQF